MGQIFAKSTYLDVGWVDVSPSWSHPKRSGLVAIDIFCGCGGLSKGLEMAGIEVIAGLDYFKEAGKTYERNFRHNYLHGDVTKKSVRENLYSFVDVFAEGRPLLVAGGFPCQGFSLSGRRNASDPRNQLYKQLLEIVGRLKPSYLFFENVKGLLSMNGGKVKETILGDFRKLGYVIDVVLLNAANYGVAQKRERVVFLGNKLGKINSYPKPLLSHNEYRTIGDAIGDLMGAEENRGFNHILTKHSPSMKRRMARVKEGASLYKNYQDSWKRSPWQEASCTIKENHGGVNIHPKIPRVLTPRECARIQSFPDDFIFEGPKQKQLIQIGNAVPPLLAKAVGLAIAYNH